jgi:hypothetical protein
VVYEDGDVVELPRRSLKIVKKESNLVTKILKSPRASNLSARAMPARNARTSVSTPYIPHARAPAVPCAPSDLSDIDSKFKAVLDNIVSSFNSQIEELKLRIEALESMGKSFNSSITAMGPEINHLHDSVVSLKKHCSSLNVAVSEVAAPLSYRSAEFISSAPSAPFRPPVPLNPPSAQSFSSHPSGLTLTTSSPESSNLPSKGTQRKSRGKKKKTKSAKNAEIVPPSGLALSSKDPQVASPKQNNGSQVSQKSGKSSLIEQASPRRSNHMVIHRVHSRVSRRDVFSVLQKITPHGTSLFLSESRRYNVSADGFSRSVMVSFGKVDSIRSLVDSLVESQSKWAHSGWIVAISAPSSKRNLSKRESKLNELLRVVNEKSSSLSVDHITKMLRIL